MVAKAQMDHITSLAAKLNTATDELNGAIEKIESRLSAARVGVSVWLGVSLGERRSRTWRDRDDKYAFQIDSWDLGYAKIGDEWRIAAKRCTGTALGDAPPENPSDYSWVDDDFASVALVSAPRVVRAEAVKHLDNLLANLARTMEEFIADVEKAKQIAEK